MGRFNFRGGQGISTVPQLDLESAMASFMERIGLCSVTFEAPCLLIHGKIEVGMGF